MIQETDQERRKRLRRILQRLHEKYPEAATALHFHNPLEMLVATILSAQCTDKVVNEVTPALFAKYRTAADYAKADPAELERMIHRTGFFRNKAKSLIGMGKALVEQFGGEVPETMAELIRLPGVARKTANVVLQECIRPDGPYEGIVVDTHVARLSRRLGLSLQQDPEKIEKDLMALVPRRAWRRFGNGLINLGREVCRARAPLHGSCPLLHQCPTGGLWLAGGGDGP